VVVLPTPQTNHAPRSGTEIKDGRSSARWRAGEDQMRDNSEGSGLNSAVDAAARRIPFHPALLRE